MITIPAICALVLLYWWRPFEALAVGATWALVWLAGPLQGLLVVAIVAATWLVVAWPKLKGIKVETAHAVGRNTRENRIRMVQLRNEGAARTRRDRPSLQ